MVELSGYTADDARLLRDAAQVAASILPCRDAAQSQSCGVRTGATMEQIGFGADSAYACRVTEMDAKHMVMDYHEGMLFKPEWQS